MKHRNAPRGGARNEVQKYLEEYEEETTPMTFMERLRSGSILNAEEEILDEIDNWHTLAADGVELHEWLGMTEEEYIAYVRDPSSILDVVY